MYKKPPIQHITVLHDDGDVHIDVLRLDMIHPIVSGNKYYKLKYYLERARDGGYDGMLSFGGAYSNHLVALSYACQAAGLRSVGIVRGEEFSSNPSLNQMRQAGMELQFVSRELYRKKESILAELKLGNFLVVPEGGQGEEGVKGAGEILNEVDEHYSHIMCAAGTGTMAAGIIQAATPSQRVLVIPALKVSPAKNSINTFLNDHTSNLNFEIHYEYHFGGFAKYDRELIHFMNELYQKTSIPTDIVYTGKLFYALQDLLNKSYFPSGSKILVIHSGGLQGNRGLKPNSGIGQWAVVNGER